MKIIRTIAAAFLFALLIMSPYVIVTAWAQEAGESHLSPALPDAAITKDGTLRWSNPQEYEWESFPNPEVQTLHTRKKLTNKGNTFCFEYAQQMENPRMALCEDLLAIPGIKQISINAYDVTITRARLYNWSEIVGRVERVVRHYKQVDLERVCPPSVVYNSYVCTSAEGCKLQDSNSGKNVGFKGRIMTPDEDIKKILTGPIKLGEKKK